MARSLLLALIGIFLGDVAAAKPKPLPCGPGRFVVVGYPFRTGGRPNHDTVVMTETGVTVNGCAATRVTVKARKRKTLVKARWQRGGCADVQAKLEVTIDAATCSNMKGAYRYSYAYDDRRYTVGRRFTALRTDAVTTCTLGLDTFEVVQQRVFGSHGCAVTTCHGTGAAGGLQLLREVAYDQLVDAPAVAAPDARRVTPGDAEASFLVRKLRGTLANGEGGRMPLVGDPVTADELALVQAWIAGGAPRTGVVDGAPCLPPAPYVAVTPPPPPAGGYQLVLEGPTLQPGQEDEACLWIPTPNAEDFVVGMWEFTLSPGTHHMAIFRWEEAGAPPLGVWRSGDAGCTSGATFGNTLSGAPQAPYFVDRLPGPVGRVLPAGGYLGLNAHYANDFDVPIVVKAWVNLVPYPGTPAHLVSTGTDFDDMFAIDVPPGTQKLQTGRLLNGFPYPISIVQLQGHMHKRGLRFTARAPSGATLVQNHDWAHPFWPTFDPPFVLGPGETIDYECLEDNGVTRPVRLDYAGRPTHLKFGLTTDDEMCTLTAIYYAD